MCDALLGEGIRSGPSGALVKLGQVWTQHDLLAADQVDSTLDEGNRNRELKHSILA